MPRPAPRVAPATRAILPCRDFLGDFCRMALKPLLRHIMAVGEGKQGAAKKKEWGAAARRGIQRGLVVI